MTEVIMNIHNDHEATCLCCKHFSSSEGWEGTDVTPGNPPSAHCAKGVFYDHEEYSYDSIPMVFEIIHKIGSSCPMFEPRND